MKFFSFEKDIIINMKSAIEYHAQKSNISENNKITFIDV